MRVALLGDIGFLGRFGVNNSRDLMERRFSKMAGFLSEMDLVVANLETPFFDGSKSPVYKSAPLRSDPSNVETLKYLNIGAVNLANNHIGDYGSASIDKTIETLQAAGVDYFGVYGKQLRLEVSGTKIALVGACNYDTNPAVKYGFPLSRKSYFKSVNTVRFNRVIEDFKKNKEDGYFNILAFHSGQEHINYPKSQDIKFARFLASKFDYVLYGHHPHVIQGGETINRSMIFYSLGNFCFDDVYADFERRVGLPVSKMSNNNREGIIVVLDFQGGAIDKAEIFGIYISDHEVALAGQSVVNKYRHYSSAISELVNFGEYEAFRRKILDENLRVKKSSKNLRWYLVRINPRYLFVFLKSRFNRFLYRRYYSKYLG